MSDQSSPHGTPSPTPPPGTGGWTPPPPTAAPPPPAPAQPSVDSSGSVQRAADPTGDVPAPRKGPTVTVSPGLVLGVVAVAAIVIGLLLDEAEGTGAVSESLWDRTSGPLWSIVAIVAAVTTLLPALHSVVNVPGRLAWTIAAVAAGYLVFWWVLFILPYVELNVAFLVTLGVGAAIAAVWTSADNPHRDGYTAS